METTKKLTRVLNVCAVIIFVSVFLVNTINFIDLLGISHSAQDALYKKDAAFNAWMMNFCLALPWIAALNIVTPKRENRSWIGEISLIYGGFFTGYYSITLMASYLAVGAYIKMLFLIFVTFNAVFIIFILAHCLTFFKNNASNTNSPNLSTT